MKNIKFISKKMVLIIGITSAIFLAASLFFTLSNLQNKKRKVASEDTKESISAGVEFDLTNYDGASLGNRIKYRLFENAKWNSDRNTHFLTLGSAKFKNSEGKTVTLCKAYPLLELVFQAEGIAIAGDPPRIIMRTTCKEGTDSTNLSPIEIPWRRIKRLNPKVRDLKELDSSFFFNSIDDFWPLEWNLHEIRLYSGHGNSFFQISSYDVIVIRGEPLNFFLAPREKWPK